MYIKQSTLDALNRLPVEHAERIACRLAAHYGDGFEFGIEGFQLESTGEWVTYVNTGDTYSYTLAYFRGEWVETTWGDIVEEHGEA